MNPSHRISPAAWGPVVSYAQPDALACPLAAFPCEPMGAGMLNAMPAPLPIDSHNMRGSCCDPMALIAYPTGSLVAPLLPVVAAAPAWEPREYRAASGWAEQSLDPSSGSQSTNLAVSSLNAASLQGRSPQNPLLLPLAEDLPGALTMQLAAVPHLASGTGALPALSLATRSDHPRGAGMASALPAPPLPTYSFDLMGSHFDPAALLAYPSEPLTAPLFPANGWAERNLEPSSVNRSTDLSMCSLNTASLQVQPAQNPLLWPLVNDLTGPLPVPLPADPRLAGWPAALPDALPTLAARSPLTAFSATWPALPPASMQAIAPAPTPAPFLLSMPRASALSAPTTGFLPSWHPDTATPLSALPPILTPVLAPRKLPMPGPEGLPTSLKVQLPPPNALAAGRSPSRIALEGQLAAAQNEILSLQNFADLQRHNLDFSAGVVQKLAAKVANEQVAHQMQSSRDAASSANMEVHLRERIHYLESHLNLGPALPAHVQALSDGPAPSQF